MANIAVNKKLDMFRRQLMLMWRDAEETVPEEFKEQMLTFRSAAQNLLIKLGMRRHKPTGNHVFDGDVIDDQTGE